MSLQELGAAVEQLPQEELAEIIRRGREEFGPLLNGERPRGLCAGQFTVPADFNDPLPEDVLRDFEGA